MENNNPVLLSICIPTYNRSKTLDGNLKVLFEQSQNKGFPIELLVSDNCSSDDTEFVVKEYIRKGMPIYYIRNHTNLGPDGNFAQCYRKAVGKYILVIGDDDYLIDGMLVNLLDYLSKGDYGLVHLRTYYKSGESNEVFNNSELFLKNISYWITYITSNVVNSKYIKSYDFEKYFSSYMTVVPLYLEAATSHEENLLINDLIFEEGVETKSNGGYNFFEAFVKNYLKIWKEAVKSKKVSTGLYRWIKRDIFRSFLTTYIIDLLFLNRTGNFKTTSAWKILFSSYGTVPYAYYYVAKSILKKSVRATYNKVANLNSAARSWYLTRAIKQIGKNPNVEYPLYLTGVKSIQIGNSFTCYKRTRLEAVGAPNGMPKIIIGDKVCINWDCHIGAMVLVKIHDNVLIGSRVLITDHSHGDGTLKDLALPPSNRVLYSKGPVVIEDNVWIGDGVAILPNVTIGRNSIIGANSVISKDVPANSVVVGNPGRIVKKFNFED